MRITAGTIINNNQPAIATNTGGVGRLMYPMFAGPMYRPNASGNQIKGNGNSAVIMQKATTLPSLPVAKAAISQLVATTSDAIRLNVIDGAIPR